MRLVAYGRRERQLTLLAAATSERRSELLPASGALLADINWYRLTEMLRARRLLPTLGPRVLDLAHGDAPAHFEGAVSEAIDTTRRHANFLELVSSRVTESLEDADIRWAALKGPAMAAALYGDVGRRASSDIDLLVAPEQLPAAVEVVRQLGYRGADDYVESSGLPKLHFQLTHDRLPPVELHWRVHYYETTFAVHRLLPPEGGSPSRWRPKPHDELAALLLYYARDGFVDLRFPADIAAWWDTYGKAGQHGLLDSLAEEHPPLVRVWRVAALVSESLLGVPYASLFSKAAVRRPRERIAVRLANPHRHGSSPQLYADLGLLDGLLAPRGGLSGFLRRQVLLPREALKDLDQRAPKRWRRTSLGRALGMLGRFTVSSLRAVLARGTSTI